MNEQSLNEGHWLDENGKPRYLEGLEVHEYWKKLRARKRERGLIRIDPDLGLPVFSLEPEDFGAVQRADGSWAPKHLYEGITKEVISYNEIINRPPPSWMIEGVLEEETVSMI